MTLDVALAVLGFTILLAGTFSLSLKRAGLSVPLVALAAGALLGPEVLRVLEPEEVGSESKVLEELARVTLAVSLTSIGLQFTREDLRATALRGTLLLTVGMAGMWAMTSVGAWLLLDLPWGIALLVGAILTPTDPVVASTIVSGRLAESNLPRRLRRTLQLESGGNDGLALVFVLLPALVLAQPETGVGDALARGALEVGIAVALGGAIGYGSARMADFARRREFVGEHFFFATSIGLALAVLGIVHLVGGSGVLAAFVAGVAFSLTVSQEEAERLEEVQSGIERTLLAAIFLFFGSLLPWDGWISLGWPAAAFVVWVLLLRRVPAVPLALAPARTPPRDVAFLSWFGPIGVAAIYYSVFVERFGFEEQERIFAAATLVIAVSVVVHTLTGLVGVRRYAGRRVLPVLMHPLHPEADDRP